MMGSNSLPLNKRDKNKANEATGGGDEPVRWEIVTKTPGLMPATIIAGRLQAEGIPARAWQEGAGQALGLTVGILGTGNVAVPSTFADKAREILADIEHSSSFIEEDEE